MRIPTIPELTHPVALAAVVVLALNDHVLKRAWPGAVTGKLSDLAGCFVLPLFLSAALAVASRRGPGQRLALGAAATAAFFAALKLSPAFAGATAAVLSAAWAPLGVGRARIVADPTDLVALPLVAAAYAFGTRIHRARGATP